MAYSPVEQLANVPVYYDGQLWKAETYDYRHSCYTIRRGSVRLTVLAKELPELGIREDSQ